MSVLAGAALVAVPSLAWGVGVSPATVDDTADPGETINVTKTISTPEIPPKPDIVMLVDHTSSMGTAIASVQAEMSNIISTVKASQPDAQFAVAQYCDPDEDPFGVLQDLTASDADALSAVTGITLCGGGDEPESQLTALWSIGDGGDAISFRPDSSRIVVWFGDAPGHDPSNGHTEADATASLLGVEAQVLAFSVGFDRLDLTGQATRITAATGGTLVSGIPSGGVGAAILAGLQNLPAEVTANTVCDTGLSVAFTPALPQVVPSGTDLVLDEAITVAGNAPQGSTLTCTVTFLVNGAEAGPEFVQTVNIGVNDVTAPTVACGPGINPDGEPVPGYQSAGFYQLVASDNLPGVTVTVADTASSSTFGPYPAGTYVKLTQAPGSTPSAVPFAGAVPWHITLKGDALVTATDAAGNTATVTCTVPPKKK
jgi:hypothetical protein